MLVRIFVLFIFCFKVFADSELDLAKKYFTEDEINESLKWRFDFGTPFRSYKTEPIKFYTNKELTGEVFAEIDDKGLKIGSKYICTFSKYSDTYSVLARKRIESDKNLPYARKFAEEYYSDKNQIFGGKVDRKTASRTTCDAFPILIGGPSDSIIIILMLRIYDKKIGSLKMKGQDVFFDVSTWFKKYIHKADIDTILREKLTSKEYEDFNKLIHELRAVIKKGSLEEIYNFVYERSDKEDHKRLFNVATKEEFLKKKMSESLRVKMLKSTFAWYRDSPYDIVRRAWYEKDICMSPKNNVLFVKVSIDKGKMFFSNFGLNDVNRQSDTLF